MKYKARFHPRGKEGKGKRGRGEKMFLSLPEPTRLDFLKKSEYYGGYKSWYCIGRGGSEDGLCCGCCCRSERLPFANLNAAAAVVELLRRPRKMFPHFSTPPQKRKRSPLPHSPSPPLFLAPPRALVGGSRAPVSEEWYSGLHLENWQCRLLQASSVMRLNLSFLSPTLELWWK